MPAKPADQCAQLVLLDEERHIALVEMRNFLADRRHTMTQRNDRLQTRNAGHGIYRIKVGKTAKK